MALALSQELETAAEGEKKEQTN